jgi:hypothetical protein
MDQSALTGYPGSKRALQANGTIAALKKGVEYAILTDEITKAWSLHSPHIGIKTISNQTVSSSTKLLFYLNRIK